MIPLKKIFCLIDDFCKQFEEHQNLKLLPNSNRFRRKPCSLPIPEIMTIMVLFHLSHYRTFKDFYKKSLTIYFTKEFPKLVRYTRFIERMPLAAMPLFVLSTNLQGQQTGKYYIDSTKLQVCENLRISSHKAFKEIAKRGKNSTGWFFGAKLHLVINHKGEIMSFKLTTGNVDERKVVEKLTHGLKGWLFGDKGYLSGPLAEKLKAKGLELMTKGKKWMKNQYLDPIKKQWLNKRVVVESVIDQLKAILHIQHTGHRSPDNFITNLIAGIVAYIFKPKKPALNLAMLISN
jgi:hypothetical protein